MSPTKKTNKKPDVQLISSLVVRDGQGRVLLCRYDPEDERWWLPGGELEPYEHPDEAAKDALATWKGLKAAAPRLSHVESFRGRRGWHVVFHYRVDAQGEPRGDVPAAWHPADALPRTAHGAWEKASVRRVLAGT
jgi:ADP-ribose pyrophosphatase YjhB (NUDIX family)